MQVIRSIQAIPDLTGCVITIGTFDGVHHGHTAIIKRLTLAAQQCNNKSVIITFDPHPRQVIAPEAQIFHLNTIEEKLQKLEAIGVDVVVVVPFSREFSEIQAEAYAEHFLIDRFKPSRIIFGYDHKFGRNRSGDIHLLKKIAAKYDVEVEEIPAHEIHSITVSSSKIRKYLQEGEIAQANELLGYAYTLCGPVVKGDQIGRTLGFPTANIFPEDHQKLIPADGVYIVQVERQGRQQNLFGLLSIGKRPTFNKSTLRIEVFILDFNESIYGEKLTVRLLHRLRADKKFDGREALIAAMHQDVAEARDWIQKIV